MRPEDLRPLDFTAPLDVEAVYALVPADAKLKGMFFQDLQALVGERADELPLLTQRYTAFYDYPLIDFVRAKVFAAEVAHGDVPLRQGLRRVGQRAYPLFVGSGIGKVLFGAFASNLNRVFALAAKAYRITLPTSRVQVLENEENHALIHFDEIYNFPDCYQVGVVEGAVKTAGFELTEITGYLEGPGSFYLRVEWA